MCSIVLVDLVAGLVQGIGSGPSAPRSDEICKVGVLTRAKLTNLLHDFPAERGKFEELVHNLMEDSVNHHLVSWQR